MKARDAERQSAIEHLRGMLSKDPTVFVIVRKHSRTGFSKSISLVQFATRTDAGYHASPENPKLQPLTLTYHVAKAMGYSVYVVDGRDVLRIDDYPQEFVANLSVLLFKDAKALDCEVL